MTVTGLCLVISLPLAILSVKFEFPGRALLGGLLLVPLVLPPFVGAVGLRTVLGTFGPLTTFVGYLGVDTTTGIDWLGNYRFLGVVVVEALHLYPILLAQRPGGAGQRRPGDGAGGPEPRRKSLAGLP